MITIVTAMSAASCAVSARPRPAVQIPLAGAAVPGQGTGMPIAPLGMAAAVTEVPVAGDNSVDAPTFTPTDVARFRLRRPPV